MGKYRNSEKGRIKEGVEARKAERSGELPSKARPWNKSGKGLAGTGRNKNGSLNAVKRKK